MCAHNDPAAASARVRTGLLALQGGLPLLLADRKPYASVAFAGCWLYIGMIVIDIDSTLAIWISAFFICFMRMICWYLNWEITYDEDGKTPALGADP